MKDFFERNKIFLGIGVLVLVVGVVFYFGLRERGEKAILTTCEVSPQTIVTKVLDGDTVIVEGGYHIRLLGIDADEKGYPCYESAKFRLEDLVLNKEVMLEKDQTDIDQYGRCLRYIFLGEQNINLQLVKEGEVVARFYPPDLKYQSEIAQAEKEAKEKEIGCKWAERKPKGIQKVQLGEKPKVQWNNLTKEKLGLEVIEACLAKNYLGKEVIVEGKVVDTYYHLKSNTVFLNFGKPYPNQCFTAVIFSSDLYKFVQKPEDYYLNKTVRIKGEIKEYKGRPEIILETPNQIEIGK